MSDHESEAIFLGGSHVLTTVGARDLTGVTVRRIWTALLTKYEREGGEGGGAEGGNLRSADPSIGFRSPRAHTLLRLARSHAQQARHEHQKKQKQISRLQILPPNLR